MNPANPEILSKIIPMIYHRTLTQLRPKRKTLRQSRWLTLVRNIITVALLFTTLYYTLILLGAFRS